MKRTLKPPLGAKPRFIWEAERINELRAALTRAMETNWPLEIDFVTEYNELVSKLPYDNGKE